MEQTIFEKIINRTIPAYIVYEDDQTIAILDNNPTKLGHTLVIPKTVSRTFLEMDSRSLGQYFEIVQKIADAIKKSLTADGLNIVINIEPAGGQEVFHIHVHIIPQYIGKHVGLNIGHHETYSSPQEMEEYTERIKAYLV